jgi:transcriptional regulator with XRE-family HTH domain
MSLIESFPERLRKYRKSQGWTQQELAKQWSFSTETISSWERGIRTPSIQQIPHLADVLMINTDELIEAINSTNGRLGDRSKREIDFDDPKQNSLIVEFRNQEECELYIRKAARHPRKVKILTIRGEKYFIGSKSLLYHLCTAKRAKDITTEVLVLSPEAEHITEELAQKLHHSSAEEIRVKMRRRIEELKILAQQNKNFEVRCYKEKPNFKILMFDDVMFVSSYAGEEPKNDHSVAMFRMVRGGNPLFMGFERHFDELAQRAVALS